MIYNFKIKIHALFLCCIMLLSSFNIHTFAETEYCMNYYVSCKQGNDETGDGSFSNPWKTIQKAADNMSAGDTCFIREGTYREQVVIKNSGTDGKPITFQAYENENVVISGAEVLTGWQKYKNDIYVTTAMDWDLGEKNGIYIDDKIMCLAKWPNTTAENHLFNPQWAIMDSGNNYSIKDAELNQPDGYWNGGKVVSPCGLSWILYSSDIVSYTKEGGLVLKQLGEASDYYKPKAGNKYYIYDCLAALDAEREWYFDKTNKKLYLYAPGGVNPSTLIVESKKRDYAFVIENTSYVNLKNLNIFAAGINTNGANHTLIEGVNLKYTCDPIVLNGKFNEISNSHLAYSTATMIRMVGEDNIVFNNLLEYGNYVAKSWDALVYFRGRRDRLAYNTIRYAGRDCVQLGGKEGFIEFNDISYAGMLTYDNGLVYGGFADAVGTEIRYNWLHDNVAESIGDGLYPDNSSSNYVIHHNVIWNVNSALRLNTPSLNILVYNNTLVGNVSAATGINSDMSGDKLVNNIIVGYCRLKSGAYTYNNLEGSIDPLFVDPEKYDFRLSPGSPAIDNGLVIGNITEGFTGTAPDLGALEYGGEYWIPGHNFENPPVKEFKPRVETTYINRIFDGGFEITSKSFDSTRWEKTGSEHAEIVKALSNIYEQEIERRSGNYSCRLGSVPSMSVPQEIVSELGTALKSADAIKDKINVLKDRILKENTVLSGAISKAWSYSDDIIPNGNFESVNEKLSFTRESCLLSITDKEKKEGNNSLAVTSRKYHWSGPRINASIKNKRTYLFSCWVKADKGASIMITLTPDKITDKREITLTSKTFTNDEWTNIRKVYTFDENEDFNKTLVCVYGTPVSDFYLDDFKIIDFTELIDAINYSSQWASSLSLENYKILNNSVNEAKKVLDDVDSTKEMVSEAINNLYNTLIKVDYKKAFNYFVSKTKDILDVSTSSEDGIKQKITGLRPNTEYLLSGWAKLVNPNDKIYMLISDYGGEDKEIIFNSKLWDYKELRFKTGPADTEAMLYINKPEGLSIGYVDDLTLCELFDLPVIRKDVIINNKDFSSGSVYPWFSYDADLDIKEGNILNVSNRQAPDSGVCQVTDFTNMQPYVVRARIKLTEGCDKAKIVFSWLPSEPGAKIKSAEVASAEVNDKDWAEIEGVYKIEESLPLKSSLVKVLTESGNNDICIEYLDVTEKALNTEAGTGDGESSLSEALLNTDSWVFSQGEEGGVIEQGKAVLNKDNLRYGGKTYRDFLLSFDMKIDGYESSDYPIINIRNQGKEAYNSGYVFVIKKDVIELQRHSPKSYTLIFIGDKFNSGIAGPAIKNEYFKMGETNHIEVGSYNTENGVRIILNINGNKVVDYEDTVGAIREAGYIGFYSGGVEQITISCDE